MSIVFAIVAGILILGLLKALLRVFGVHFAGDRERRTCSNCGTENIEHLAVATPPHWLFWEATSEHDARCGLPCGNGLKLTHEQYRRSMVEGKIHNGGKCPRCRLTP